MATKKSEDSIRAQIGPFAMLPVWLLKRCRDSRAIHLYGVLGKYGNREQRAWPKREQLAADMGVSVKSVQRALEVLRDVGALKTTRRHRADGSVCGLDFLIIQIDPSPDQVEIEPVQVADEQKDTGVPLVAAVETAGQKDTRVLQEPTRQKDTHVPLADAQKDTGVHAIRTPVSPQELDPLNQIQEQDRETAAQRPLLSVQVGTPTPDDFAAYWNARTTLPLLRCTRLTPGRRRHVAARLTERSWDEWGTVIDRIERSSFCRGQNERGWVASFGWLISAMDVAVKVTEGVYDDRPRAERPFTKAELEDARQLRHAQGGCRHDPRCENFQACIAAIIRRWREQRGEGTAA